MEGEEEREGGRAWNVDEGDGDRGNMGGGGGEISQEGGRTAWKERRRERGKEEHEEERRREGGRGEHKKMKKWRGECGKNWRVVMMGGRAGIGGTMEDTIQDRKCPPIHKIFLDPTTYLRELLAAPCV